MFKALHINKIKYASCSLIFFYQRTSGGSEELHGQKREIEQLRRQDPTDRSHHDRYKDSDDDDTPSQRKGIRCHHDRNENNDGVDLAYVDLKRGHESHD